MQAQVDSCVYCRSSTSNDGTYYAKVGLAAENEKGAKDRLMIQRDTGRVSQTLKGRSTPARHFGASDDEFLVPA